jgi:uncharacterized protein YbjQ (UPF0145 family)
MGRTPGLIALALAVSVLLPAAASADDAVGTHELASVSALPEYANASQGVTFYFGDSPHPAVSRRIEENVTTSLRTRKFGRSSEEACQRVMLSALIQLRDHAVATGGNAVINIRSNWRNTEVSSRTQYQCAAGFLMAGVALKGDVVRIP